ncbi:MAG: hypothetical protein NTW97_08130 [Candidatus Krumholzibacteria bacterium]|nr:hypothetical protein [Candidatus Krumholzibacteria bacterium]
MSSAMRFPATRMLVACALACVMVHIVPAISPRAEETKSCVLAFSLLEGTILNYTNFSQIDQNYGGSDVSMNQTSNLEMKYGEKADSTGAARVDFKFSKVKSSLVMNGQLREWTPPIKLEGAEIRVFVTRDGKVARFEPGKGIIGMSKKEDLRDVVDALFVKLPDTVVSVGGTWTEEIEEGKKEGAEPEIKGTALYTLKKIEKKGDIEVAVIEAKANVKMNSETPAGMLVADGKIDIKAQIAVAGGYIVELKQNVEIRGDVVEKDPLTDKVTKRQTAVTRVTEIKLQR